MTTIKSGLNTTNQSMFASANGLIYSTNNFDPVQVWDGVDTAMRDAGITGPAAVIGAPGAAAGGFDNGDHSIRYRYKNSRTGFVSNPSPALTYTVAGGNGLLTFTIGIGQDIIPSTDAKVDTIVVEATPVGSAVHYQVGTAANTAASIVVGMVNSSLIQQENNEETYGSAELLETFSNEKPPLGTILVPYRGRMWVLGDVAYALTGVTFTNGSANVTGTGFSTSWAGFIIYKTGDALGYEIASVASANALTLTVNYGGSTSTSAATVARRFPNRGYYSRLFYPEQFYPAVFARDFLANRSDQVVAAIGRKDGLYVFGRFSAERLMFNVDPAADQGAVLSPLQGDRGAFNKRCICPVEGNIYAFDRRGMWIVNEIPKHISLPIDDLLESLIDYDQADDFHVSYEPVSRTVLFFFTATGDTVPKYAAAVEIDSGRWGLWKWFQGITASAIVPTTDGQVRLMLGDENGYSWYQGISDTFDGVPPNCASVLTVVSDDGLGTITVSETLPTVAPTLVGVIAYDPLSGQTTRILSGTASTIVLHTPFTPTLSAGDEVWVGAIEVEYRTKWWVGPAQSARKNPPWMFLSFYPGSATGKMRVYFYADNSTTPSTCTATASDTFPDGVTIANGSGYIEVDMDGGDGDGVLWVPVPIEWKNLIQARLTSVRPDGALRILDFGFALTKGQVSADAGT